MFNIGDQLSESFDELMVEIRGMRRELERIRKALESQADAPAPAGPVRAARTAHRTPGRVSRKTAA